MFTSEMKTIFLGSLTVYRLRNKIIIVLNKSVWCCKQNLIGYHAEQIV